MEKSLNEYLEVELDSKFDVNTEAGANWSLRKIKALEDRKQANEVLAKAEIEKVNAWLSEVNGSLDRDLEHFHTLLLAFAENQRKENPKFKSLKLINGKIGFRKQQPKWNYDDETLIQSLLEMERPDLIRTLVKQEVDKKGVKSQFTVVDGQVVDPENGEVIEGVTVEDRPDELKIETA